MAWRECTAVARGCSTPCSSCRLVQSSSRTTLLVAADTTVVGTEKPVVSGITLEGRVQMVAFCAFEVRPLSKAAVDTSIWNCSCWVCSAERNHCYRVVL